MMIETAVRVTLERPSPKQPDSEAETDNSKTGRAIRGNPAARRVQVKGRKVVLNLEYA